MVGKLKKNLMTGGFDDNFLVDCTAGRPRPAGERVGSVAGFVVLVFAAGWLFVRIL
jgi:hypothetical protein